MRGERRVEQAELAGGAAARARARLLVHAVREQRAACRTNRSDRLDDGQRDGHARP